MYRKEYLTCRFLPGIRSVNGAIIILMVLFALFTTQFAPTAFARGIASKASQPPTCLQAPANLDPRTLTNAQLRIYGLPERPPNPGAQTRWLLVANRIKLDRHDCHPQLLTDPALAHYSTRPHSHTSTGELTPSVTQYTDHGFAGNYATGSAGSYTFSDANWNLPCMNTSTRNARASFWLGLGGFGNDGYLVQAGTDVIVDSNGHVTYSAWIESTDYSDYRLPFVMPNARCGNTMYIEVDSNFEGNGVDYFIIDGGGINISETENWPTSIGDAGECMVERLHDSNGNYYDLADFNYIAFSNCDINANGVGNLPHNYDVMIQNTNLFPQEMAGPGSISNGGQNYNVNWFRAN